MLWNVEIRYTDGTSRPVAFPITRAKDLELAVAFSEWHWLEEKRDGEKVVREIVLTPVARQPGKESPETFINFASLFYPDRASGILGTVGRTIKPKGGTVQVAGVRATREVRPHLYPTLLSAQNLAHFAGVQR